MKRFASHYVYVPGRGFLKRYVVEVQGSHVAHLFPLTEEVENTVWMPGVIVLLPEDVQVENVLFDGAVWLDDVPPDILVSLSVRIPYLFYPFDFNGMKPVVGTRSIQLR